MGRPLIGNINRGTDSSVAKLLIPKLLSKNLDGPPNGRPSSCHRLSFLDRGPAKNNSGGILGGVQHKIFTNVRLRLRLANSHAYPNPTLVIAPPHSGMASKNWGDYWGDFRKGP